MRKTIVLAVAFALGGSALSTNAFALASAYGGGHLAPQASSYDSGADRGGNFPRGEWAPRGR